MGIDPGTVDSAWVAYNSETKLPIAFGKEPNAVLYNRMRERAYDLMAIEEVCSYGMPIGASTITTIEWIGRYQQYWEDFIKKPIRRLRRKDVGIHICSNGGAKDPNIRQALMDRYGSQRQIALGTIKNKGPLYGMSKDVWSAFAISITAVESQACVVQPSLMT